MALIDCPECDSRISTRAEICVHCGHPVEDDPASSHVEPRAKSCPDCEEQVPAATEVCGECGHPFLDELSDGQSASQKADVHPWRRWLARHLDYDLFTAALAIFIALLSPEVFDELTEEGESGYSIFVLAVATWVPFEALLVALFGTTPGKLLLSIRVRSLSGGNPDFGPALRRALHVWVTGVALGIPLVNLVTMVVAHSKLTSRGTTTWDKDRFQIVHGRVGAGRIVLIVVILLVFLLLMFL